MTYTPTPRRDPKELRKARRQIISYRVWLKYGNDPVLVPCALNDISATGARLNLPNNDDVPDEFELMLTEQGPRYRSCVIAWRSTKQVGVRFVDGPNTGT